MSEEVGQALVAFLEEHQKHGGWREVGICVYCGCGQRLYQGRLPQDQRPAACEEHDWDEETGLGFYMICRTCGEREWFE